jgi:DNA primase large subunit
MRNEDLTKREMDIWMEEGEEEEEELQWVTEKLIDVGEDDLPDCRTRDETWELVDEKFREGRLRAMKMWLEEIKKRFREGRIDEQEE